jgi:hypothetical protein
MKHSTTLATLAVPMALALSVSVSAGLPADAVPATDQDAEGARTVTTEDLADSSPAQQGWLSAPQSRITLNPGNPQYPGEKGSTIPLSTEYFAYGAEQYVDPLMSVYRATGDVTGSGSEEGGTTVQGFSEDFSDLTTNNWKADNVELQSAGGRARVTTMKDWGKIASSPIIVDLSKTSMLTVEVAQAPAGANSGAWALKIQPPTGGDRMVQPDTTETGTFTYDLSKLEKTSDLKGVQTFSVYLFVSGGQGKTIDFDGFDFWGRESTSNPEAGQQVVFADDFTADTADRWVAPPSGSNGATYASDGIDGTVALPANSQWGSVARTVSVDVDKASSLSLWVGSTDGQWAIKVQRSGEGEVELQHDTSVTGVQTFDLKGVTGWSGTQTFLIRLYHIGAGTSTTFERLSLHSDNRWLSEGEAYTSTWQPEAIDYTIDYGQGGSASGFDVPVGIDALGRTFHSDLDDDTNLVVGGVYSGSVSWDITFSTLTVTKAIGGGTYTWVAALPSGADIHFFATSADMRRGVNALERPAAGQGAWAVELPDGDSAVGVGFAMGSGAAATSAATASAQQADTPAELQAARAGWKAHWDKFLSEVPVPQDFNLNRDRVDTKGVDEGKVRQLYYTAWIGLGANVMQATPETGGNHVQIATGKPSTYASGPKGAEASAAWDSLFGMQFLAQVDPDTAWDAFKGNMENAVPEEGHFSEYEVLPSRKAQTAWILFQVTGRKAELEGEYATLVKYLDWAAKPENMRWSFSGKGESERDAEFYVSMIVDLGYAQKISSELGQEKDVEKWKQAASVLTADYEKQFFPRDKSGVITSTLYKHWTDGTHPDETGLTQYVATGLHVPGLSQDVRDALLARFDGAFEVDKTLAGMADDNPSALKAPDAQFIAYGLLDQERAEEAAQFLGIVTRDIARAGVFAEVYESTPSGPRGTSVAPSIFGNINFIDNLWLLNGYRMDQGDPAFVRLESTTGGISGLTYLGQRFDADVRTEGLETTSSGASTCTGEVLALSGDAVDQGLLPKAWNLSTVGETVFPTTLEGAPGSCGATDPTPEPTPEPSHGTGSTEMSGAAEANGRDDLAGLANSGAKILPFVLGALVLSVLGGGALALKRRKS